MLRGHSRLLDKEMLIIPEKLTRLPKIKKSATQKYQQINFWKTFTTLINQIVLHKIYGFERSFGYFFKSLYKTNYQVCFQSFTQKYSSRTTNPKVSRCLNILSKKYRGKIPASKSTEGRLLSGNTVVRIAANV